MSVNSGCFCAASRFGETSVSDSTRCMYRSWNRNRLRRFTPTRCGSSVASESAKMPAMPSRSSFWIFATISLRLCWDMAVPLGGVVRVVGVVGSDRHHDLPEDLAVGQRRDAGVHLLER